MPGYTNSHLPLSAVFLSLCYLCAHIEQWGINSGAIEYQFPIYEYDRSRMTNGMYI